MANRESPAEQVERLLRSGDAAAAERVAGEIIARTPGSPVARLARCRALLQLARYAEAEVDVDAALRVAPRDEQAQFLRGAIDIHLGRVEEGVARLRPIAASGGRFAVEAHLSALDILYNANRRDEWRLLVESPGAWRDDIRAPFHLARAKALEDPVAAAMDLRSMLRRASLPPGLRRHAGFEGAGFLDRAGDYRGAFELARETHATTGQDFDLEVFMKPLLEQAARVEQGADWIDASAPPVEGVAMLVSLPRSGTTLLEQMVDRHPEISGIGEYEGMVVASQSLAKFPAWPRRPGEVPAGAYAEAQRAYLAGAHRLRRADARWSFDKGLRSWRSLPEIAAVLPGAVGIAVHRDPRDLATSLFLSYFHTSQIGWTLGMHAIRRVIEVERRIVPRAMEVLGIRHRLVIYEDLVEDPAREAGACLELLGLPMDDRVLAPEGNARAAVTLSAMQVRRPINRGSIGRWRNYAFAFDSSWDALAADHERLRDSRRSGG